MTAPIFRSLDQLTGDVSARPSAFFEANAAADERVDHITKLTEANQWLDNMVTALAVERDNARAELDNTMQSMRDLGSLVAGLTSAVAMWHAMRDEQRERADEWRDKAEDYLATIDELQGELREQQAATRSLQNALAGAESARDTARAAVSGF